MFCLSLFFVEIYLSTKSSLFLTKSGLTSLIKVLFSFVRTREHPEHVPLKLGSHRGIKEIP